jgi:uncharacterized protein HemX
MSDERHTRQLVGSLLVAALIVAGAILIVTLQFGSTSTAEQEAREERLEQRLDAEEERREEQQDRREDGGER